MSGLLLNHLWQSTLAAAGVWVLALILRNNGARVRFWLWFAASAKFLLPFAALTALSKIWLTPVAPAISAPTLLLLQPMAQPFSTTTTAAPAAITPVGPDWLLILAVVWAAGFVGLLIRWMLGWLRLRRVLRDAKDFPFAAPVGVKLGPSNLEPGLVGLWRPVILLPQGIAERLSAAELDAIVAHEVCHWRRRDNLLAAIHMLVEALFWFYPLIWWLGARLNAEREHACDEAVLASGVGPQPYAESILKVCKLYLHSPLACVAGVSGADLKIRIETIVAGPLAAHLNAAKKSLLAICAVAAIGAPVVLGLLAAPMVMAEAQDMVDVIPTQNERAIALAEQNMARVAIPYDPKLFDRYVGHYQMVAEPNLIDTVSRDGNHFFVQLTGQAALEVYPESQSKFFLKLVPAQVSFVTDSQGRVIGEVLHQNGREAHARKISDALAQRMADALALRIKNKTPNPGTEASLRRYIESLEKGQANYDEMTPALAAAVRQTFPATERMIQQWGALKSLSFKGVDPQGWDIYDVVFEHGHVEWGMAPLMLDGKVDRRGYRELPY